MNNFATHTERIIFVVIVVGSILISPYTFAFVFSLSLWTVYEFHKLTNVQSQIEVSPILAVTGSVILFSPLFSLPLVAVFIICLCTLRGDDNILELYRKKENFA